MSGSKGPSEQAQRIACECHSLDVLHLQNAPKYCDNTDPNGCGGRFNKEDCEIYRSAQHIDAALRAAKVEGLRDGKRIVNNYNFHHNHGKSATLACDNIADLLDARIAELEADARAAQIEEGE